VKVEIAGGPDRRLLIIHTSCRAPEPEGYIRHAHDQVVRTWRIPVHAVPRFLKLIDTPPCLRPPSRDRRQDSSGVIVCW
jgi:hypothetical protein